MDVFTTVREVLVALVSFGAGWLTEWIRRQVKKRGS